MAKKKAMKDLYSRILEDITNTLEYSRLQINYSKLEKEFEKDLTEDQKKQFLMLSDLSVDMNEESRLQIFAEGFGLAVKIMTEVYYKEDTTMQQSGNI